MAEGISRRHQKDICYALGPYSTILAPLIMVLSRAGGWCSWLLSFNLDLYCCLMASLSAIPPHHLIFDLITKHAARFDDKAAGSPLNP